MAHLATVNWGLSIDPVPATKLVQQTEDVVVDWGGTTYITGKQWGLFVLRYTGKGAAAPAASKAGS